jgi:hypothetical protein
MVCRKRCESGYAKADNYQAGQDFEDARLAEQDEEKQDGN